MVLRGVSVTFCAWGVEQIYNFRDGPRKGKSHMVAYLKRRWPGASHVSFDVRGLWNQDPHEEDKERGGEYTNSSVEGLGDNVVL